MYNGHPCADAKFKLIYGQKRWDNSNPQSPYYNSFTRIGFNLDQNGTVQRIADLEWFREIAHIKETSIGFSPDAPVPDADQNIWIAVELGNSQYCNISEFIQKYKLYQIDPLESTSVKDFGSPIRAYSETNARLGYTTVPADVYNDFNMASHEDGSLHAYFEINLSKVIDIYGDSRWPHEDFIFGVGTHGQNMGGQELIYINKDAIFNIRIRIHPNDNPVSLGPDDIRKPRGPRPSEFAGRKFVLNRARTDSNFGAQNTNDSQECVYLDRNRMPKVGNGETYPNIFRVVNPELLNGLKDQSWQLCTWIADDSTIFGRHAEINSENRVICKEFNQPGGATPAPTLLIRTGISENVSEDRLRRQFYTCDPDAIVAQVVPGFYSDFGYAPTPGSDGFR